MLKLKCKKLLALLMLVYFVCYAVAPVSSVMPSSALEAQESIGVQEANSAGLLLCDLVLWEILKKAKQPEVLGIKKFKGDKESGLNGAGAPVQGCLNAVSTATALFFPEQSGDSLSGQKVVYPCPCFDRSGLSPPAYA